MITRAREHESTRRGRVKYFEEDIITDFLIISKYLNVLACISLRKKAQKNALSCHTHQSWRAAPMGDPNNRERGPSVRAQLRALLAPAWSAAVLVLLYALAIFVWQEAAWLMARGGEIWARDRKLRRRAKSVDAGVFLQAWQTWLYTLAASFWDGIGTRAAAFVAVRFRKKLLALFLCAYVAVRFRLHSMFLVQLDAAGLGFVSDAILGASRFVPFLGQGGSGGAGVGSGDGPGEDGAYEDVPDLYDEDEEGDGGGLEEEAGNDIDPPASMRRRKHRQTAPALKQIARRQSRQSGSASRLNTNESVPLASSAVPPVVAAPEAAFPSPAGSESIERPDGWLVFDSVYGAIPHEVATRWKQSELDSQRRREKHKPAHEASSSRVLPPVRSPVSR